MDNITERLNQFIEAKGLRNRDIAKALGISDQAVSSLRKGVNKPSKPTVMLLSNLYGLNESWLLDGVGDMFSPPTKEQEIAQITTQLLRCELDSKRFRLLKLISQMNDESLETFLKVVTQIASIAK